MNGERPQKLLHECSTAKRVCTQVIPFVKSKACDFSLRIGGTMSCFAHTILGQPEKMVQCAGCHDVEVLMRGQL